MSGEFIKKLTCAVMVVGCIGVSVSQVHSTEAPSDLQCLESRKIKVVQVLNDGILARFCVMDVRKFLYDPFEQCNSEGDMIFLKVDPAANDYVDDQKVTLPENKCFVPDGTYSYTAKVEKKRVRKVRIAGS
jgi:hypothetical protein